MGKVRQSEKRSVYLGKDWSKALLKINEPKPYSGYVPVSVVESITNRARNSNRLKTNVLTH